MLEVKISTNSSGDKDIYILMFLAGVLSGLLLISFILWIGPDEQEKSKVASDQTIEITQMKSKTQKLSVNGYNLKTTTLCFEGKQILFVFYRGEPQIINLNKDCGETK